MAKVVGIGGVFFRAENPDELMRWYADTLELPVEGSGGSAMFSEPKGASAIVAAFPADTDYFGTSGQAFMINLRVDDLDGCLRAVATAGGTVDPETTDEPYGRFGWFADPEGNRVELWEPTEPSAQP